MVLEVLAHAGQVHQHVDTALLEDTLGADTAQLKYLGSMDCTRRHNDFLVSIDGEEGAVARLELDSSGRQVVVQDDSAGHGVGQKMVVWSGAVDL